MEFHIHSHVGDSVLFDSRKMNNNNPVPFQLTAPAFKGDLAEGFSLLTAGDSAIFRVPVDSVLAAGNQLLPWMQKGKGQKIQYEIKVVKVQTQAQKQAEMQEMAAKQVGVDEKLLQDYFTKNNIKPMKTASGLYYKIDNPGNGANAMPGQNVTIDYTGMTLSGEKFDSNVDPKFQHVQPFSFVLGQGQVIKGWDEGVALLKKGAKATLYIPSTMAYGAQSPSQLIAPNSVLIFNVEVKEIAAAAPQEAPAQGGNQPVQIRK